MYPPKHYQSRDKQKMIAIAKQFPLATLVTAINNTPYITHLPVIFEAASETFVFHIDANNLQVTSLVSGKNAILIFKGPDTYISPSIYKSEQLPTWNYVITHITGTIEAIKQPELIKQSIVTMTQFLEAPANKYQLKMDNPKMQKALPYIKAFKITPTKWEGKFKLSQDKNKEDFEAAKQQLLKKSKEDITAFIEKLYW